MRVLTSLPQEDLRRVPDAAREAENTSTPNLPLATIESVVVPRPAE